MLSVKRSRGVVPLAAVLVWGGIALQAADIAPVAVDGKIHWVYSYAEGQQLARETGKPLFVVFRCER